MYSSTTVMFPHSVMWIGVFGPAWLAESLWTAATAAATSAAVVPKPPMICPAVTGFGAKSGQIESSLVEMASIRKNKALLWKDLTSARFVKQHCSAGRSLASSVSERGLVLHGFPAQRGDAGASPVLAPVRQDAALDILQRGRRRDRHVTRHELLLEVRLRDGRGGLLWNAHPQVRPLDLVLVLKALWQDLVARLVERVMGRGNGQRRRWHRGHGCHGGAHGG